MLSKFQAVALLSDDVPTDLPLGLEFPGAEEWGSETFPARLGRLVKLGSVSRPRRFSCLLAFPHVTDVAVPKLQYIVV